MGELTRFDQMTKTRQASGDPPPDLFWTCKHCGEIAPLLLPTGRYIRRSCACERAIRHAEAARVEREQRARAMAARTYGGWLGERAMDYHLARASFADLNVRGQEHTDDQKRLSIAIKRAQAFAEHPQGTILLFGKCGLSKTHLLASICNALRQRSTPVSSLFTTAPRFFTSFYNRMEHDGDEWELVQQAILTPFLVIDDLDKSSPKPFRQEVFFQIIDERVKDGRPLGISTNTMEGLASYIGEQSYSRLMVGLQPVKLTGSDYRLRLIPKE